MGKDVNEKSEMNGKVLNEGFMSIGSVPFPSSKTLLAFPQYL